MWQLRQDLMGRLTETVIDHTHASEAEQTHADCPTCHRTLKRRREARRTVDTLIGPVELSRPYFYCSTCYHGLHTPYDIIDVGSSGYQCDIQLAFVKGSAEIAYESGLSPFSD